MTEYELDELCKKNPDCGCDCMRCPLFAKYYRDENGLNDYDENP